MRVSHDCETSTRVSHDSREIFVRASHDSRETLVRVSHDLCANFNQFYFSQLSLEIVLFMSHIFVALCRSWKLPCDVFANVCKGLVTGSRQALDISDIRRFCDDFCRTKKYYMFKTLVNHLRRVHDACEDFAIPCEHFATVLQIGSQTHRELVAYQ